MKIVKICQNYLFFLAYITLTALLPHHTRAAAPAKHTWHYVQGFPCVSQTQAISQCRPPSKLPSIAEFKAFRDLLLSNRPEALQQLQIWGKSNAESNTASVAHSIRLNPTFENFKDSTFWTSENDDTTLGNPYFYNFKTGRGEIDSMGERQDRPYFCISEINDHPGYIPPVAPPTDLGHVQQQDFRSDNL